MGETVVRGKRKKKLPLFKKTIKKNLLPIATFDIETNGMGGDFLDACISLGDGVYHHVRTAKHLAEFFVAHPGYRYYAHNGAGYDFSYIMDEVTKLKRRDKFDVKPIVQGKSRIIGLVFKKDDCRFELRDSLALIPMSLKKAAHIFAPKYEKMDINLAEHVYDPNDPVDIEYLHRDVDALYHVMENFERKIHELYGTPIGFTAGSTAMYAWQAHIPEGHAYYRNRSDVEQFCFRGYYGGFVYPGHDVLVHKDVVGLDRNAAFAASMRQGVSTGNPIETDTFYPQYGGMYEVVASVPESSPLPILPSRDTHGNLRWCTGTFTTVVTTQEILFARSQGVTVDVLWGYYWPRHEFPFNTFLDICERVETELSVEDKEASKIQRNALYGKFGMKPEGTRVVLLDSEDAVWDCDYPLIDEHTGAPSPYIAFMDEVNESNYIMPIWAAEITANARIELMKIFLAAGMDNVYYGDTDSCFMSRSAYERLVKQKQVVVSRKYGDVKVDKEFLTFQALGPKNYHGILKNGEYLGKAKGIPNRKLTEWKLLMYQMTNFTEPPEFEFESALSAFMKLKYPNKPIRQERTRKLSTLANSASWRQVGSYVYPLHVDEPMVHSG